ncbi:MAG: inorganic phosphate transporter [Chloroflexi bacterium]|nr:inorganic phosphate transporter [Chloroflexota bacterium]MBI1855681.1 inorganic phosphate transporter [Chloroflexota bacterium]MBI3338744.1 inorganic phosphate transporter [Chloroflexota bacterium]
MPPAFIFTILLALVFDFLNAVHGSSNIVATMISSRAFRPWTALWITAVAEFIGPFLFGVAVARTIGSEIVQTNVITLPMLLAGLIGTIVWSLLTWFLGIPSSPSHALVGGLIGTALIAVGPASLHINGVLKAVTALFVAPLIGFGIGFVLTRLVYFLAAGASPRVNEFFKRGQFATAVALAISHGANDAQKAMGVIVLALVIGGFLPGFNMPFWVTFISAAGMALGTLLAGWRLIRTVGGKFYKIRPIHSFSAQLTSTLVLLGSSLVGWPVSATQVISSAIIGVGSSERFGKVRWSVAGEILITWILTIPASALLSAGIYWLITNIQI